MRMSAHFDYATGEDITEKGKRKVWFTYFPFLSIEIEALGG